MIYKDISIVVNGTDLSASLRGLEMTEGVTQQDATAHGDTYEFSEAGLQNVTCTAQFWQDYSSGGVDETISALLSDTDGFTVVVKPTSGSVSGTNPSFTATMNVASYERFTGQVGDRGLCTVEFANAASTGMARAEA